ncbi:MAG: LEA type 2 family protein [Bacteroidales bacterium]|nr:LEA type 2 family protein [Bacteroidales bacterium]
MNKKIGVIAVMASVMAVMIGCSAVQQIKTLSQCSFNFIGVSNFSIAGVSLDKVTSPSQLTLTDIASIMSAITNKTAQISFDANVKIHNPSAETATVNKLAWKVDLDGEELLDGVHTQPITVKANGTTQTAIRATVDATKVLKNSSIESVYNLYKNLTGKATDKSSNVVLKVKPTIDNYTAPGYISIKQDVKSSVQ